MGALAREATWHGYRRSPYSPLLLVINRRFLPDQLKVRGVRMLVLLWAAGLFGVMSVLVVINEASG